MSILTFDSQKSRTIFNWNELFLNCTWNPAFKNYHNLEVHDCIQRGWQNTCYKDYLQPYFKRRLELTTTNDCILWEIRWIIPGSLHEQIFNYYMNNILVLYEVKWWLEGWFGGQIWKFVKNYEIIYMSSNAKFKDWRNSKVATDIKNIYWLWRKELIFLLSMLFKMGGRNYNYCTNLAKFGISEKLASDNGPQLVLEELKKSKSNGAAVRTMQIIKKALTKIIFEASSKAKIQYQIDNNTIYIQ